jgi:hypothetical protein
MPCEIGAIHPKQNVISIAPLGRAEDSRSGLGIMAPDRAITGGNGGDEMHGNDWL